MEQWSEYSGKRIGAPVAAAGGAREGKSRRLFVHDRTSAIRFLVDTGADVSVVPANARDRRNKGNFTLFAANNSRIATYGERILRLDLQLRRDFKWPFIIADVSCPIIGTDFLSFFGLLPDLRRGQLLDGVTALRTNGILTRTEVGSVTTFDKNSKFSRVIADFPGITQPTARRNVVTSPRVQHVIETTGPPVFARARRLEPERYKAAKLAFQEMLQAGEIRPSKSPWASPIHMVPKERKKPDKHQNATWRICGDFRALNAQTKADRYPVPNIQDFNTSLSGCKVFTKLDLVHAYHQVPVAESDIEKTAVITPFGLFEYVKMPFGLKNAAQTFQRYIDGLLRDFHFAYAYIDDIFIASKSSEEHDRHVRAVLRRLHDAGLTINAAKCCYAQNELSFLGYSVSAEGIRPCPERVQPIFSFPQPKTVAKLRWFLGMINFYRRCLPNSAVVQSKLFALIKTNKKRDKTPVAWTEEATNAFGELKKQLADAALLAHPNGELPITITTDASDTAIGAALHQIHGDRSEPLAFFSRKLSPTESRYSTYDRELLAIYAAIRHFRQLIEGRNFAVYTDHRPLVYAFQQNSEKASPRQRRHLELIGQYTTDIRYIKGCDNIPADVLSRIETMIVPTVIPYDKIAEAQLVDKELQELLNSKTTKLQLTSQRIPESNSLLFCDNSTGKPRPFIPEHFRNDVFRSVHNLAHSGPRATARLISTRFVWPSMRRDCSRWSRACTACQLAKVGRHTKAPLGEFEAVDRFAHVHIDIVGPLPPSRGKQYVVTFMDRTTRWPEAIPVSDISAESMGKALVTNWIARFGVPATITTDQGRQFESNLYRKLTEVLGTDRIRTTAYHPQANGMIERWHRTLKAAIMANRTERWVDILPFVLLGLRSVVNEDREVSPAQITYGTELRLPADFFPEDRQNTIKNLPQFVENLRNTLRDLALPPRKHGEPRIFVPPTLATAAHVFLRVETQRKALQPPYTGPHRVVKRGEKTLTIQVNGKEIVVSVDRVKPAFLVNEDDEATPGPATPAGADTTEKRGRGRPRKARFQDGANLCTYSE